MNVREQLLAARQAERALMRLDPGARDRGLGAMATALRENQAQILAANALDLAAATGLDAALVDRLRLDPARVEALARAVESVRAQADPLNEVVSAGRGPSGIEIERRRVPLGVIAIVYESRPNVAAECAALTLKSGNAVVLRGGKEAAHSSAAIVLAIHQGLQAAGLDPALVQRIEAPGREAVVELLQATGLVDLVIPRGGAQLMALVDSTARVPVIRHGQGICHVYVDRSAEVGMAIEIADNAKTQRPGVCNAMETLLVHADRLEALMQGLGPRLARKGVELRADPEALAALARAGVSAKQAQSADYDTEFLSLILAIRTVHSLDEALAHIAEHGSHHTASIVTEDTESAARFLAEVDASCVLHNASTRLNDGGELGLGAEMGISTSKLHAYGPMGAQELTQRKFVVRGTGQVRR
ncbi:MAG: glutamate-5-semialdehyde dehydrogenase [Myxococcota bacterium]